jgi:2-oxoglutarate ferredoxin oxidoreductase subunit gamma
MDQMDRIDIRLAGLGGQGLLLAGLLLGEASAVTDKLNVAQTVNYAPLARGAPSRAEVVISKGQIYYPEVEEADIFLAMSQDSYDAFKDQMKPGGIIIVDTVNVSNIDSEGVLRFPISKMAEEATGRSITGSVVGLGLISKITGKVSADGLRNAIKSKAPRGTVDVNLKALEAGLKAAV